MQEFAKQHGTFLLYGQTDKPINIWLLPKLLDDGADVRVKWGSKNNFVWEVTQRSGSAAASGK